MIPVSYNLRNLTVRKTTTIATALGIALVVFVFASVLMLNAGIKRTLGRAGRDDRAIILRSGSESELGSTIDEARLGQILTRPGVKLDAAGKPIGVGEVVVVVTLDKKGTKGVANVSVRGVTENAFEFRPEVHIADGRRPTVGTDECIVGKSIRGRFKGLQMGGTFELKKGRPLTVVGIFTAEGSAFESEVWADYQTVRAAFGRQGLYSSMRVQLESPEAFKAFADTSVQGESLDKLKVERETKYYEKQSEGTSQFLTVLGIVIAVFFSVGAMIGAMNTMFSAVAHRKREIGTLRALGFSRFAILVSFLFESIALSLVGGGIGILASMGMSFVKFSTMNFATWSEVVFRFQATPGIMVGSLVFATFMGIFGGFFPALKAALMSPLEAMRA